MALPGLRSPDGRIALATEAELRLMDGYAGSVAFSANSTEVAITSPRGGRALRFDADGRFLGSFARAEVCGVAPRARGFLLSDGLDGLIASEDGAPRPLTKGGSAWDTHVVTL